MDKKTLQGRTDAILPRLKEEQTALESLPARRDTACQAYLDLEVLRVPAAAPGADAINEKMIHASRIVWALYEALHQDYQQDLEWTSNHPPED